ncbi:enoyl-CoA hydratase/isomerase family protein [Dyadobacter sediminis]|uniref:Enoyl-CoA hydratase n=1 Tax=Dyadobacter sediminis TaxID=1493691 RepID=A0A5R9K905_9BACT|nr:enoyl-CoA hydratase-related protein [Dyadobacter sediminis]TLU90505.1 enoyl-CoA hydratase [Dyadobacter sediminis]GGC08245.1 enoyl-CoA hydratase [Dyadobacter sediminis]
MRFYTEEDVRSFDAARFLYIKTSLADHTFTITLNRPHKRNAFTPSMAAEITFALAFAHYHSDVRCIIINAEGPVFCAGADLNAFHDLAADTENTSLPAAREEIRLGDAFAELLKPSIAQVEGAVIAGGFLMVCGCTFVVCTNECTFSLPEVKRGIWPMQVMASLLNIIPPRKILEMAITGKSYNADEAFQAGLVTSVTEKESIAEHVKTLATEICRNAPLAIQSGMKALTKLRNIPPNEQHAFLKAQLDHLLQTEDAREGTRAFKEKRTPVWKGK